MVEAADRSDGTLEARRRVVAEEVGQVPIDRPSLANTGEEHAHGVCRAS
jgi:hypothetical protein